MGGSGFGGCFFVLGGVRVFLFFLGCLLGGGGGGLFGVFLFRRTRGPPRTKSGERHLHR